MKAPSPAKETARKIAAKVGAVPELDHLSGSWVCTSPDTDAGNPVREVYERKNAELLAARGWRIQTAYEYLVEFNKGVKFAEERRNALADFDREFLK